MNTNHVVVPLVSSFLDLGDASRFSRTCVEFWDVWQSSAGSGFRWWDERGRARAFERAARGGASEDVLYRLWGGIVVGLWFEQTRSAFVNGTATALAFMWPRICIEHWRCEAFVNACARDDVEAALFVRGRMWVGPDVLALGIRGAVYGGHARVLQAVLSTYRLDTLGLVVSPDLLAHAMDLGRPDLVSILLDHGADPAMTDNRPIRWAATAGHADVVRRLLRFESVDPTARDNTPLIMAVIGGYVDVVVALADDPRVDVHADEEGALRTAIWHGKHAVASVLLDRGADVGVWQQYPVRTSAERGDVAMVRLFVERGADATVWHNWVLRRAFLNGHEEVARYVLGLDEVVADVWAAKLYSHAISKHKSAALVRLLLEFKVPPHFTAMRAAIVAGAEEVVGVLLTSRRARRAFPSQQEIRDEMMVAAREGHEGIVRLLARASPFFVSRDHVAAAAAHGHAGVVRALRPWIFRLDEEVLTEAAARGDADMVELLLDLYGMDARANRSRALRRASAGGFVETVRVLLAAGADPSAKRGRARWHARWRGHAEVLALLNQSVES